MLRDDILRAEAEFPKLFASYEEKSYGILFYNENDKDSHDSNHAILYPEKIGKLSDILNEIKDFYLEKGIEPRIYHPYVKGYFADNKKVFEDAGFEIIMYGDSKFMLLTEENEIEQVSCLDIKRITHWDERIVRDIYLPNDEEYEIEVEKVFLKNNNYYLFVGFLDDKIVSMVSFHLSEYNCTRFNYIVTAPSQRGKGYARYVISQAVEFCRENKFPNCFQWPMHDTSQRISTQAGFRVAFQEEAGAAVYKLK